MISCYTRLVTLEYPSAQIEKLKKKYEPILKDKLSDLPMEGPPMKVHFKKEALEKGIRPKKIFTAPQTPFHLKPAADKVLAEAIESKLIEEVPTLVGTNEEKLADLTSCLAIVSRC